MIALAALSLAALACGAPAAPAATASGRTAVPFELVDNRIVVLLTVNGHGPLRFILDTGAEAALSDDLLDTLGVARGETTSGVGVGESARRAVAVTLRDVRLGDIRLTGVPALASSFADDFVPVFGSYRIDGVIGRPLFERYVVEIDYARCVATFIEPARYAPPTDASVVPIDFAGHLPVVRATLDGVGGVFGLDTGARTALIVYGPFADAHGLRERYRPPVETITGWGIGGPVRTQVARAGTLAVGTASVRDVVIRLSTQRAGLMAASTRAGLIGPDVLKRFAVTFDYGRRRVILRPAGGAAALDAHDTYDRSGMWLAQHGESFAVLDVVAGGPAAAAGIRAGDVVVAVDGARAAGLVLPAVRDRLRTSPAGTRVRLRVARAGRERNVALVLRDLV
jgi:Aspartyl protease/PDZ domain